MCIRDSLDKLEHLDFSIWSSPEECKTAYLMWKQDQCWEFLFITTTVNKAFWKDLQCGPLPQGLPVQTYQEASWEPISLFCQFCRLEFTSFSVYILSFFLFFFLLLFCHFYFAFLNKPFCCYRGKLGHQKYQVFITLNHFPRSQTLKLQTSEKF